MPVIKTNATTAGDLQSALRDIPAWTPLVLSSSDKKFYIATVYMTDNGALSIELEEK